MAEYTGRCFDRAMSEMGPTQLNIPRDYFYGEIQCEIPKPMRVERGHGGENSLAAAVEMLAHAKFPVILSGGGHDLALEKADQIAPLIDGHLSSPR
jgi:sulfoacetaldehyde acetyltransferase